jgi:hypothetical protein
VTSLPGNLRKHRTFTGFQIHAGDGISRYDREFLVFEIDPDDREALL